MGPNFCTCASVLTNSVTLWYANICFLQITFTLQTPDCYPEPKNPAFVPMIWGYHVGFALWVFELSIFLATIRAIRWVDHKSYGQQYYCFDHMKTPKCYTSLESFGSCFFFWEKIIISVCMGGLGIYVLHTFPTGPKLFRPKAYTSSKHCEFIPDQPILARWHNWSSCGQVSFSIFLVLIVIEGIRWYLDSTSQIKQPKHLGLI